MSRVLLVTRHDYRTRWRANLQPIADGFVARGDEVRFVSAVYSWMSKFRHDHRREIEDRANRWERVNGVDCYLWSAPFHPVALPSNALNDLAAPLYTLFAHWPCRALDESARWADLIVVESGSALILLPRLRARAPDTPIVYLASDLIPAIGAPPLLDRRLDAARDAITRVVVAGRAMAPELARLGRPMAYVPHGLDRAPFERAAPSPYRRPGNVVTVGSMLFDPSLFQIAAEAFPDIDFHLIGTPAGAAYPANVNEHGPMAFADTIPWLRHADVGVAPYRREGDVRYLADSSMKLMQYGHLGLPALCPDFAVGDHPLRFGYAPGDAESICGALAAALDPAVERRPVPTLLWREVADRIADPDRFPDTRI